MTVCTQLPAQGEDASPPASPHLPPLEYPAAAGAAAVGGGGGQSDEEDAVMADAGGRSRAHSHSRSMQRSPPVGEGDRGGAAIGWSLDAPMHMRESMRGGGRARPLPHPQQQQHAQWEEELKEEKREEPGTGHTHDAQTHALEFEL